VVAYKRGSLLPTYQLTPEQRLRQFNEQGVNLTDQDFQANGNFQSASQKLVNIQAQVNAERQATGDPTVSNIVSSEDSLRSDKIPFRANPSHVKLLNIGGRREAWVPLGGDVMTVGNEVVAIDITDPAAPKRAAAPIRVGVRPQRIAIHPAGINNLVFVANQYSNYISVIDSQQHLLLTRNDGTPVEVKTDFYVTDLIFVPQNPNNPDADRQDLYVSNAYRGSVTKYGITLVRSGVNNTISDITVADPVEITGVGTMPDRLSLSQDTRTLFVANQSGGELARIDLASRSVRKVTFNCPAVDVVQVNDVVFVPTTTCDRGLPANDEAMPAAQAATPMIVNGQVVHPGSMQDTTKAYNFEDLRNGILTLDAQLPQGAVPLYQTDDISVEPKFINPAQRILRGSIPLAIATDKNRTRIFMAMSGSDTIQEFKLANNGFRLADAGKTLMHTKQRPFSIAFDDAKNEIVAVTWGGESIEIFDPETGVRKSSFDVANGVAVSPVPYPATNIEKGEYLFYNTSWSNNGRKSCGQCHLRELLADGIPYANGVAAASMYHKVPQNFNLMTTDNYFWTGAFTNGTYASLASDAQSRSNCELVLFGLIEGITSDPNARVGDPLHNFPSLGAAMDNQCRPTFVGGAIDGVLPNNFATIATIIDLEKAERDRKIRLITQQLGIGSLGVKDVSRFVDWYDVAELRLPPTPLAYLAQTQQVDPSVVAKIENGKTLFTSQGCAGCHQPQGGGTDPTNAHPFTDDLNHGPGSNWVGQFIDKFKLDARVAALLPAGFPQNLIDARRTSPTGDAIDVHLSNDFFVPFCFTAINCLQFFDPVTAAPQSKVETDSLNALIKINLQNADRGFVPGNVIGSVTSNTPALRGLWVQTNYLRHGLAHNLSETILPPGSAALAPGEKGWAIDVNGKKDVHGNTSSLSKDQVDDLFLYLNTL